MEQSAPPQWEVNQPCLLKLKTAWPRHPNRRSRPWAAPKNQPFVDELQSSGDIRILILDDDPATCSVIQAALSNRDFVIDVVSDPALVEATLARPNNYHLIILDYVLPGLEADQVFTWIRDAQPDANVVVITGYPSVDSALNCLRARTYDYLTKPFQVDSVAGDRLPLPRDQGAPAA